MDLNQYFWSIVRMDLRHLRYFVAVAEERHFTRAAERLGIKQPPLSLQIKQLEQELGTPLFRRLTRGVELTQLGTLLLDEARQILEQVERTKANVRNRARGETGHIRVGFAGATYFQPRVPGLIQAYRECYPDVLLSPVQSNTPHLVEALRNGSVDVAFVRPPLGDGKGLTVHPLLEEPMRIVLPSKHPQARAPCRSPPWRMKRLYFSPGQSGPVSTTASSQVASVRDLARSWDKKPRRLVRSYTWWRQGFGISIVPHSIEQVRADSIVYVPIKGEAPRAPIGLAVRRDNRSAVIRNFVALASPRARARD
jgi:DNA-binding transcriptional LysR family regulator